jgi:hypothetical protein
MRIQYIESVEQAMKHLERIQQFGDPTVAFDLCLNLESRSIPCRLVFCPSCPVAHYLPPDEYCPTRCVCGSDHFIEMAHIELIIQDSTVVYRKET